MYSLLQQLKAKRSRSGGFTIVELLIVIVIIAILATLVIVTFTGYQQRARNNQRQTDIKAVQSYIEAYYADKGHYPTAAMLNDSTWRQANMKGLDPEALNDPKIPTGTTGLAGTVSDTQYGYAPTAAGVACPAATGTGAAMVSTCDAYTLTANLEGGGTVQKSSN